MIQGSFKRWAEGRDLLLLIPCLLYLMKIREERLIWELYYPILAFARRTQYVRLSPMTNLVECRRYILETKMCRMVVYQWSGPAIPDSDIVLQDLQDREPCLDQEKMDLLSRWLQWDLLFTVLVTVTVRKLVGNWTLQTHYFLTVQLLSFSTRPEIHLWLRNTWK